MRLIILRRREADRPLSVKRSATIRTQQQTEVPELESHISYSPSKRTSNDTEPGPSKRIRSGASDNVVNSDWSYTLMNSLRTNLNEVVDSASNARLKILVELTRIELDRKSG